MLIERSHRRAMRLLGRFIFIWIILVETYWRQPTSDLYVRYSMRGKLISRLMSRSINRRFASLLHISRYSLHRSTIWDCCVHLIHKRQKGYCKLRHIFWSLCCTSSEVSNANDNHWSGEANSNSFNMTATKSRSSLSHIHFLVPDKRSINNIKHQYR